MQEITYVLDPTIERGLCDAAIDLGERLPDGMSLIVGPSESIAGRLGRVVEQRVFDHTYGGHSPEVMSREYRRWEELSLFITLVDASGVVGCFRMIWSPSLVEPTKVEVDLDIAEGRARTAHCDQIEAPVWEVSTCVVVPGRRRSLASAWLMGEMLGQVERRFPAPLFSIIAVPFFRTLKAIGFAVTPLADLPRSEYLGAFSQPAHLPVRPYGNLVRRGHFLPTADAVQLRIADPVVALDLTGADPVVDLTNRRIPRSPADVMSAVGPV